MLNDRVLPFFEEEDIHLLRLLTDRRTEFCWALEHHEYELYLAIEDVDHSKSKARHPQTNGICERFHQTIQEEFYHVAFRKDIYHSIEELQTELDKCLWQYNHERAHTGKYCFGKTPYQMFQEDKHLAKGKMLITLLSPLGIEPKLGRTPSDFSVC